MFVKLVPVVALTAIMSGFFSTGVHTAKREMQLARLTILELLVQAVAMAIMIAWALISPTVWALVAGGVCGSVVKLVLSHIMLGVPLNRFGWDKEAVASLLDFGKWIFINSGLFFLSTNCDRLLVGRLLNMTQFGVFSVAYALSQPAILVNHHLARSVFMPMLARTDRERPARLVDIYYRYRFYLDLLLLPALGALVALAPWAVYVLYDYRYAAAGAMLQLFAVHAITRCLAEPCESCALALGYPKYITVAYIVRTIWIVTVIPLGWWFGGVEGVVWAACLKEIVVLGILWWFLAKLEILRWSRELLAVAMALAGFTCGTFLLPLLPI
jgi:O-antigen/teichoic acid export membrane protein